jgi:16S rRNA (cytidine1402-2'-O)-methyltransferase
VSATPGSLVLVATPIGNLGDLSARARDMLASAGLVCCEDTRRTRVLLSAVGVSGSPRRLRSLHRHNESARIAEVLHALADGQSVAVVSDAGTPGISDPGSRLVAAAIGAGFDVTTTPGPSAAIAALVISGLSTDRFCVEGFLPRSGSLRRARLVALVAEERTTVVFEAPGRVALTLGELADLCGERSVAVARELTKIHEEVWRGSLSEAARVFGARALRGEVVIVLAGAQVPSEVSDAQVDAVVRERLELGETSRDVANAVAARLGVSRHRAYEAALAIDREAKGR